MINGYYNNFVLAFQHALPSFHPHQRIIAIVVIALALVSAAFIVVFRSFIWKKVPDIKVASEHLANKIVSGFSKTNKIDQIPYAVVCDDLELSEVVSYFESVRAIRGAPPIDVMSFSEAIEKKKELAEKMTFIFKATLISSRFTEFESVWQFDSHFGKTNTWHLFIYCTARSEGAIGSIMNFLNVSIQDAKGESICDRSSDVETIGKGATRDLSDPQKVLQKMHDAVETMQSPEVIEALGHALKHDPLESIGGSAASAGP